MSITAVMITMQVKKSGQRWSYGPFQPGDPDIELYGQPREEFEVTRRQVTTDRLPMRRIAVDGRAVGGAFRRRELVRAITRLEELPDGEYSGIACFRGESIAVHYTPGEGWRAVRCLGPLGRWPEVRRPHIKAGDVDRAVSILAELFTPSELVTLAARIVATA